MLRLPQDPKHFQLKKNRPSWVFLNPLTRNSTIRNCVSILLILSAFASHAQDNPNVKRKFTKELSSKDKQLIVDIFKTIQPQLYYLEFNNGKEVYGTKQMNMEDLAVIRKGLIPVENAGVIINWTNSIALLFVIENGRVNADLESILGNSNASRLKAVIKKYSGGPIK